MASSTDIFSEYMSNVDNFRTSPTAEQAWISWQGTPEYKQALQEYVPDYGSEGGGIGGSGAHAKAMSVAKNSPAFKAYMQKLGVKDKIGQGFEPAYGYVKGGSQAAAALLRSGYEDAFRARAAGFTGAMSQEQEQFGAEAASQGLSPDMARRMIAQRRSGGLQALSGSRADYSSQLGTGLSELAKGTGTELAGLAANEAAIRANYEAAIKGAQLAAKGAKQSGIASAIGMIGQGIGYAAAV